MPVGNEKSLPLAVLRIQFQGLKKWSTGTCLRYKWKNCSNLPVQIILPFKLAGFP